MLIPVLEQKTIHDLLLVFDLTGTFVFAISGAMLGARRKLDIFGIMVLSFAASRCGGYHPRSADRRRPARGDQ